MAGAPHVLERKVCWCRAQRLILAQEEMFCDEFHLVDLRVYENCKTVVKGCEHVFNLAADMGGEG